MPGRVASSAAAEATMTESPIAVTCRPDTFGGLAAAVRHAAAGAEDAGEGAEDAGEGEEDAGEGEEDAGEGEEDAGEGEEDAGDANGPAEAGPAALAWAEPWDAAPSRWPPATGPGTPARAPRPRPRATPVPPPAPRTTGP